MSSHAHNHCAGVGGAIYVTKYAVLTLHGANNFTNNSAGTYGGAIYTILCLVSLEPPNSVATLLSMVVVQFMQKGEPHWHSLELVSSWVTQQSLVVVQSM